MSDRLIRVHEAASALRVPSWLLLGCLQDTWEMPRMTTSTKVPLRAIRPALDHQAIQTALLNARKDS